MAGKSKLSREVLEQALIEIESLRCRIAKKITQPDADGDRSNLINASTDVLPQLYDLTSWITGQLEG